MYESVTAEEVQRRILSRLTTNLQTREGSFTADITAAAALELADIYHAMDGLEPRFYLEETSGMFIDRQAAVVGITRKAGTRAECAVTFTGKDGARVPAGTPFYTAGGTAFLLREDAVVVNGSAAGTLEAAEPGADGNIAAGEITQTLRNYSGIESYTNGPAEGGTDAESDAALLARYLERMRRPATSGNPWHYRQWANSVEGVGYTRVISKWDGPGTVKTVLADPEGRPAGAPSVERCAAYLETVRPVGPEVTTASAGALSLDVRASLVLDRGTALPDVKRVLEASLSRYCRTLMEEAWASDVDLSLETMEGRRYTVYYNRSAFLLLSVPGVLDFTEFTLNGGKQNLIVEADAVPVVGTVELV